MSNNKQFDLTEGKILNRLLLISLPIIGSNVFQMLYMFIDMFFLGRLSSDAVAASGTAGMYIWLSMALFLIGAMGAEIGVSQNLGANNPELAKRYSQNATCISLILGVFFSIILILFSLMTLKQQNVYMTKLNNIFQKIKRHICSLMKFRKLLHGKKLSIP